MSGFELRPVDGYRPPRYPSPDPPGRPMIANRAAAWTLVAIAPLSAIAAVAPHPTTQQDRPARPEAPPPVQRLSEQEIEGLVGDLRDLQKRPSMMRGFSAAVASSLTEAEVRTLLDAFFKKNGLDSRPVVLLRLKADADLEEVALLRARGESRVLVLDAADFEYDGDGSYRDSLPPKIGAVQRLLAELERYIKY